MAQTPVPITTGTGAASVAAEVVSGVSYQEIEVYGPGGASVLSVNPDGSFKASIIGTPAVTFSGSPSISGAVTVVGTPSISGSVGLTGTPSISGTINIGNSPSVYGNISGSVVGFLSSTSASVITAIQGSVAGVNTLASIATANGGLPIWSPLGSRIVGTADFRGNAGASIAVVAAAGSGVRNYIDAVQIMNFGSASVLVTLADNTTSILGYTIAPAGGGSNYNPFYRGAANSPITASINGIASVLVSMQGFTSST